MFMKGFSSPHQKFLNVFFTMFAVENRLWSSRSSNVDVQPFLQLNAPLWGVVDVNAASNEYSVYALLKLMNEFPL